MEENVTNWVYSEALLGLYLTSVMELLYVSDNDVFSLLEIKNKTIKMTQPVIRLAEK